MSKFSRPAKTTPRTAEPAAKAGASKRKPAAKKSKYAGIQSAGDRTPLLTAPAGGRSEYRLRITDTYKTDQNGEYYHADFEVVETDSDDFAPGDVVSFLQAVGGKSQAPGLAKVKAFMVAAAGYEGDEDFDEFDPDGLFLEEMIDGDDNGFAEQGITIVGRLVDVVVTRGKARDDGDYYREHSWTAVPDDEQEGED